MSIGKGSIKKGHDRMEMSFIQKGVNSDER